MNDTWELNNSFKIESKTLSKEIEKKEFGSSSHELVQTFDWVASGTVDSSKKDLKRRKTRGAGKERWGFASAYVNPPTLILAAFKDPTKE